MVLAWHALPSIGLKKAHRLEMAPFPPNQNNTSLERRRLLLTTTDTKDDTSSILSFLARDPSQLLFASYFSNLLVSYSAPDAMTPETHHDQGLKHCYHIILNDLFEHKSSLRLLHYEL